MIDQRVMLMRFKRMVAEVGPAQVGAVIGYSRATVALVAKDHYPARTIAAVLGAFAEKFILRMCPDGTELADQRCVATQTRGTVPQCRICRFGGMEGGHGIV